MRKGWFVLFFLVAVATVIYTSETSKIDWSIIGLDSVTPGIVLQSDLTSISTPIVFDTPPYTPVAYPTPYPTYTPYPTPQIVFITNTQIVTPIEPITIVTPQFVPKAEWQIVFDYTFARCLVVLIVLMMFASMYFWYAQYETTKRLAIQREMYKIELQHKQLDNERVQIEASIPPVRPIITNRNIVRDEPKIVTKRDAQIEKRRVIEFVTESLKSDGIGLVVSKWKNERKWDQTIVESILDYLSDLNMITPRQNGRACEWLDAYRPQDVLKRIADDQLPPPRETDGVSVVTSSV